MVTRISGWQPGGLVLTDTTTGRKVTVACSDEELKLNPRVLVGLIVGRTLQAAAVLDGVEA